MIKLVDLLFEKVFHIGTGVMPKQYLEPYLNKDYFFSSTNHANLRQGQRDIQLPHAIHLLFRNIVKYEIDNETKRVKWIAVRQKETTTRDILIAFAPTPNGKNCPVITVMRVPSLEDYTKVNPARYDYEP